MKTLKFKTNINCGNCIKSITPFLDEVTAIKNWSVDTEHSDKILTIEGEDTITTNLVIETVEDAGFDILALS
ncbi:heavy-metal-associated domain-containing protein [Aureispira anguillae]|uniref:Heavy-metal-associated domain-containing protein n=1 Tax=Aureispira anguillae TaxID=2864201 RepID=A0A916DVU1_9BACT|nr:heavy-metal-associated domain-containing protein [Aureispira anguillae]BDS13945.1 heavy-metal-associated domain-containing protein [Aureispira anguillae]